LLLPFVKDPHLAGADLPVPTMERFAGVEWTGRKRAAQSTSIRWKCSARQTLDNGPGCINNMLRVSHGSVGGQENWSHR
jgi:hypothetical protein